SDGWSRRPINGGRWRHVPGWGQLEAERGRQASLGFSCRMLWRNDEIWRPNRPAAQPREARLEVGSGDLYRDSCKADHRSCQRVDTSPLIALSIEVMFTATAAA